MKDIRKRFQGGIEEHIEMQLGINGCEILHSDNEDQWKEIRMGGLGGSDIAAVIGYSEYSSIIDTWVSKAAINDRRLYEEWEEKQSRPASSFRA